MVHLVLTLGFGLTNKQPWGAALFCFLLKRSGLNFPINPIFRGEMLVLGSVMMSAFQNYSTLRAFCWD